MALKPAETRDSNYLNYYTIKVLNTKTGTVRGMVPTADLTAHLGMVIKSQQVADTTDETLIPYKTSFKDPVTAEEKTEDRWLKAVQFTGRLVDLKFGNYDNVEISIMDEDGDVHCLQINDNTERCYGFAVDFYRRLPNIDLAEPVTLMPYAIFDASAGESGRLNEVLVAYQPNNALAADENGKITSAFTKDSPDGPPAWKSKKSKGKTVWDKTETSKFYEDLVEEYGEKIRAMAPVHEESEEVVLDEEPPF